MLELFNKYSVSEIFIFLITFALAIKGLVSFYDWSFERLKKVFNKETKQKRKIEDIKERLEHGDEDFRTLFKEQKNFEKTLSTLNNQIRLLVESDKDSIKSYITERHHYYCYERKWIDDYSLDCLEKRFKHYVDEGGNSFVEELMNEIRELEKQPPQQQPPED